jgi:predicted SnoaL-like aldol condensation-catalyzing enzyme
LGARILLTESRGRKIVRTGADLDVTGIGIFRFSEGKVVESWDNLDQLGMMKQLGAVAVQQ